MRRSKCSAPSLAEEPGGGNRILHVEFNGPCAATVHSGIGFVRDLA